MFRVDSKSRFILGEKLMVRQMYVYRITEGSFWGLPAELVAMPVDTSMDGSEDLLLKSQHSLWSFANFVEGFTVRVYFDLKYGPKPQFAVQQVWNQVIDEHINRLRELEMISRQKRELASERFKHLSFHDL
jgi:hypothetical protein